jgi:hypothetical protein
VARQTTKNDHDNLRFDAPFFFRDVDIGRTVLVASGRDATSRLARSRRGVRLIVIATVLLVARTCPKFHVELFWIEQLSGPPFLTYSWYSLSLLPPRTHQQAALHQVQDFRKSSQTESQTHKQHNANTTINRNDDDDDNNGKYSQSILRYFILLIALQSQREESTQPLPHRLQFVCTRLISFHFIWFHLSIQRSYKCQQERITDVFCFLPFCDCARHCLHNTEQGAVVFPKNVFIVFEYLEYDLTGILETHQVLVPTTAQRMPLHAHQ